MPEKLTDARVLFNRDELEPPEDKRRISEVVEWVEQEHVDSGEVLTRAVLNGEEIQLGNSVSRGSRELTGEDLLELYGRPTRELSLEAFQYAEELLPAVVEDLDEAARMLRGTDQKKGLDTLSDCVWLLDWFLQIAASTKDIFSEQDPRVVYRDFPESEETFKVFAELEEALETFRELQQAQEKDDLVLLADLVDFELKPMVGGWAGEAGEIAGRLDSVVGQS